MQIFRLVLQSRLHVEEQIFEFQGVDAAEAFAYVEKRSDVLRAEIWRGEDLLCKFDGSDGTGPIWTINPHNGNKNG